MSNETAPPRARAGRREWLGLAVLTLPTLLVSMDFTVLYLALPPLAADLDATATQQLWIMDVYGFLVAGLLITMGGLGDRIGRRRLLLAGAAAFGAASVLAAFSTSAEMLIVTRAVLGVAGATLMPSTLALVGTLFADPRQRASAIGLWAGAMMTGGALGPIVGGLLLERFWWGSAFLLGVPVMVLLLAAGPLLLPEVRPAEPGRLEPLSVLLSLAAILPVVYGVKELAAGAAGVAAVAAIGAGVVFGALFVRRQRRLADPLLDLGLFAERAFGPMLAVMLAGGAVLAGYFLLLSQYVQMVLGLSPAQAGLWLSPASLTMAVCAAAAPHLARRVPPAVLLPAGLVLAAAGMLLLTRLGTDGGLPVAVISMIVVHAGVAPVFALGTDLVVGSAPPERAGSAASVSETSNELGVGVGMATVATAGFAVYRHRMDPDALPGVPGEAAAQAREGITGATAAAEPLPSPAATALLDAAHSAFTGGLHVTALIGAAVFVVLAVVTRAALRPGAPRPAPEPTAPVPGPVV
ncbi:MFS transporter [Thermomonospora amylolytica]|uniref:MFS transporter n=1 Tax=Thermomonospora amylolytica TaxID=1411117 RepID=UPI000E6BF237|nr:MFS transporter [Thermomonospora amylolytica]